MTALFDEDPDDYRKKNTKKKKNEISPELEHQMYLRKCIFQLSKGDYKQFYNMICNNRDDLKYHTSEEEKEQYRTICQTAWRNSDGNLEDLDVFDDIFGFYLPMDYIPQQERRPRVERELTYFGNQSYEAFYQWATHPNTELHFKQNPHLKPKLIETIEKQKSENVRRGNQVGYLPEHDRDFEHLLEVIN